MAARGRVETKNDLQKGPFYRKKPTWPPALGTDSDGAAHLDACRRSPIAGLANGGEREARRVLWRLKIYSKDPYFFPVN